MHSPVSLESGDNGFQAFDYPQLCEKLGALLGSETDFSANAANTASLLFLSLPDVNWVGFYRAVDNELILGPFQGKPACTRIQIGKGVCGTAALTGETVMVPDVDQFPGHIACDTASRSEIVVPLVNWGKLLGVLDVDSASLNRFSEEDREGLECLASMFVSSIITDDLPDFHNEPSPG